LSSHSYVDRLQVFEVFANSLANWAAKFIFLVLPLQHAFVAGLAHHQMATFPIHHLRLGIEADFTLF